jgi:hypothetical protein
MLNKSLPGILFTTFYSKEKVLHADILQLYSSVCETVSLMQTLPIDVLERKKFITAQ